MGLHSSVGRAWYRYRGGHALVSSWSPDFFQASSIQLLKLEIYCDDHSSLSSTPAVQIWMFSYILQINMHFTYQKLLSRFKVVLAVIWLASCSLLYYVTSCLLSLICFILFYFTLFYFENVPYIKPKVDASAKLGVYWGSAHAAIVQKSSRIVYESSIIIVVRGASINVICFGISLM